MSELLEQGLSEKNTKKIIFALREEIKADPAEITDSLKKALETVENLGINIWAKHDGWYYEENTNYWTKEYHEKVFFHSYKNFSKERFEHLREVGKIAYANEPLPTPENEVLGIEKVDTTQKRKSRLTYHIAIIGAITFILSALMFLVSL